MAKKKQLAGKKTKLAKLPLTQALAGQGTEASWPPEAPGAPPPLPLGETAPDEAVGPLTAVYIYLVQELTTLQAQLSSPGDSTALNPPRFLPRQPREPVVLELALWRARQSLQDLRSLLSEQ